MEQAPLDIGDAITTTSGRLAERGIGLLFFDRRPGADPRAGNADARVPSDTATADTINIAPERHFIDGRDAADFRVVDYLCSAYVDPQAWCYIALQFSPRALGARVADQQVHPPPGLLPRGREAGRSRWRRRAHSGRTWWRKGARRRH